MEVRIVPWKSGDAPVEGRKGNRKLTKGEENGKDM